MKPNPAACRVCYSTIACFGLVAFCGAPNQPPLIHGDRPLLVDYPVLHHDLHVLVETHVLERTAGHRNHVRLFPRLDRPTSLERPSRSEAAAVADWMACTGVIPYSTTESAERQVA